MTPYQQGCSFKWKKEIEEKKEKTSVFKQELVVGCEIYNKDVDEDLLDWTLSFLYAFFNLLIHSYLRILSQGSFIFLNSLNSYRLSSSIPVFNKSTWSLIGTSGAFGVKTSWLSLRNPIYKPFSNLIPVFLCWSILERNLRFYDLLPHPPSFPVPLQTCTTRRCL